jgi:hypothetical protein
MRSRHRAGTSLGMIATAILACLTAFQSGCVLALVPAIEAGGRKGFDVVVSQVEGFQKGELVGVKADGLVIMTKIGVVTVALSEITSVRVIKKMNRVSGGLIGAVAGGLAGIGVAKLSNVQADDWGDAIGKGSLFIFGGMVPGAVAGALLADQLAKDEVYILKNKSGGEIEKILAQLRKRAGVTDYR